MIQINLNRSGTVTSVPILIIDDGSITTADLSEPGRVIFRVHTDKYGWQFHVQWAGHVASSILPRDNGAYEGSLLTPPLPDLVYDDVAPVPTGRLRVEGESFINPDNSKWYWKGATDFRLLERFIHGEDINPILDQRKSCGANILRVVAMKANNTGWELNPLSTPGYWDKVREFFKKVHSKGLKVEFTVFCDTRSLMPSTADQQRFWGEAISIAQEFDHVLLELINEMGHPTQYLDPNDFSRPGGGLLASHGSGLTDAPPVHPLWDFGTYHARRDPPPDTRGFTNYDAYEFQAEYPKPCPFIPDEGMKPASFGYDPTVSALMGAHASMHSGGTFHTDINSDLWDESTETCARVFFASIPA